MAMKGLILLSALVGFTLGVDYCALPTCLDKHIACNINGHFGENCPNNSRVVKMESQEKLILALFNELRNILAGGQIEGLPKAVRMARMSWCEELSHLALLNVKTCESLRDQCRSTERFAYAGQNNAIFSYSGAESEYTDAEIVKEQIENWFSERPNASPDILANFPKDLSNKNVAKFTIAVAEKNTHVGCAAVRFSKNYFNYFVLTCNFATSNLCHVQEIYDNEKVINGTIF